MKTMNQKDIEKAISKLKPPAKMTDREHFWARFKERAERRTSEAQGRPLILFPAVPRWALAAACVMIAVLANTARLLLPSHSYHAASVGSWEVLAPHSAVVVVNDESTSSTIMWIVDMETDSTNGGTS